MKDFCEIPWDELKNADGESAASVPQYLLGMESPDLDVWVPALEELMYFIERPGSSEATAAAVPFLVRLASKPQTHPRCRGGIVQMLAWIALADGDLLPPLNGTRQWSTPEEHREIVRDAMSCRRAVWEGFDEYVVLLQDNEADVRMMVPYLLAMLGVADPATLPPSMRGDDPSSRILNAFVCRLSPGLETIPEVKASVVFGLASIGCRQPEAVVAIANQLRDDAEPVRLAAAIGIATAAPASITSEAVDILRRSLTNPSTDGIFEPFPSTEEWKASNIGKMYNLLGAGPHDDARADRPASPEFPWCRGALSVVVKSFCQLPLEWMETFLADLKNVVAGTKSLDKVVEPVLRYVFRDQPIDPDADQLSRMAQVGIMEAICANPEFWRDRMNINVQLVKLRLPQLGPGHREAWRQVIDNHRAKP